VGGTLMALSFKVSIPKILASMLLFAIVWGVIMTYLIYQLSDLKEWFH
jgi:hypothetical protein